MLFQGMFWSEYIPFEFIVKYLSFEHFPVDHLITLTHVCSWANRFAYYIVWCFCHILTFHWVVNQGFLEQDVSAIETMWLPENKRCVGVSKSPGLKAGKTTGMPRPYEITYTQVPTELLAIMISKLEPQTCQGKNSSGWHFGDQWPTADPA